MQRSALIVSEAPKQMSCGREHAGSARRAPRSGLSRACKERHNLSTVARHGTRLVRRAGGCYGQATVVGGWLASRVLAFPFRNAGHETTRRNFGPGLFWWVIFPAYEKSNLPLRTR